MRYLGMHSTTAIKRVKNTMKHIGLDSSPLSDQHQLFSSTYKNEIWRQSLLGGRASRMEQYSCSSS